MTARAAGVCGQSFASFDIYLSRGYIDPTIAMPAMLGVLAGSLLGTHIPP